MRIINTNATPEQQKADMKRIKASHNQAMKEKGGTWGFFGGVITIENRHYQVVDK